MNPCKLPNTYHNLKSVKIDFIFHHYIWCVGQLGIAVEVGGGTFIEHYMYVNALSDSWKYSTRERDRQYITRVQNANTMVERIKANPPSNFEIIDDVNIKHPVRSQIIHEHWYPLNLGPEYCKCVVKVFICKHLLDGGCWWRNSRILNACCMLRSWNVDDLGENNVVFPPHSPQPNLLSLSLYDIDLWDDNIGIVHVYASEVEDLPQFQDRLAS